MNSVGILMPSESLCYLDTGVFSTSNLFARWHYGNLTPSFSYRIEHCSNSSKFLVREKTRTRTYDTRTNFLYQDSRTSFLYKKLGPSAIGLRAAETRFLGLCFLSAALCTFQQQIVRQFNVFSCCFYGKLTTDIYPAFCLWRRE